MGEKKILLPKGWYEQLLGEFDKEYMINLKRFLVSEKKSGKQIFPPGSLYFNALNSCDIDKVKVVILGQDPYHDIGQAHGLCFSVPEGISIPPSLENIFKEINHDLGCPVPPSGNLQSWADQGVLLLNSVLTVQAHKAGSHRGQGWEQFTDKIVEILDKEKSGLVFLLWGAYAQKKGALIDRNRHLVLQSPHPSPLSAHRGFFGNHHFSQANAYLEKQGKTTIEWGIPVNQ